MDRHLLLKDEAGFTFSELLVVLLIIGVLAAVAVPTFLGTQHRASATVTVSDERNALMHHRLQELP